MRANVNMVVKGKPASSRMSSNQPTVFQLKQRVVNALSKLADRDTFQIGVEELDKTLECLTPDGVAPFVSCILDTDSEQKSAVRKECIRLMGMLATFHEGLVWPHLSKMVGSIVKRLKDSDSVVRDACVETVGVLASKLSSCRVENDEFFVVLVRPLFEALGEQNKHVQSGSALCLSRVVDSIHDPPPLVLQKMLARTVKLLKNPHFMAKPAVIELNRSIILAGGTTTQGSLTAALTSIQEALKNSDWATRKAACAALGDIASCGVACLSSYRTSCIRSLESCRFDKVKPVRDVALPALQMWRNLPGPNTPEPSEAGSSLKETSYRDDYGEIASASDSTTKKLTTKFCGELAKKRAPLSSRKAERTFTENSEQSGTSDWQVEIAVPKRHNFSLAENQNDGSDGSSSGTKRCERMNSDVSIKNIGYNYVEVDDKQECSSVSVVFPENIKSKVIKGHGAALDNASLMKSTGTNLNFVADEASIEDQRYMTKRHDCRSLDSTVTEATSHTMHESCSQTENEMVLIRKQLLEIENKQCNLMDMLKEFTASVIDSVSMIQLKVSNLELVVDKMAQELAQGGKSSDSLANKLMKRNPSIVSPRLSTCSSRPSVDSNKQPPSMPTRGSFGKQNTDMWSGSTLKSSKSSLAKSTPTSFCPKNRGDQIRDSSLFDPAPTTKPRINKLEMKNNPWKVINDYLCDGDLEAAYGEALCSRNELLLFELMDRTGPVLENLSEVTAGDLFSTLALFSLEQRFVNSVIPWLQQLVDLSKIHGPNYLVLSAKAKRDFLYAIHEATKLDAFNTAERKFIIELGKTLRQLWG